MVRARQPADWQQLLVPEQITIARLHHVTQLAMGWNHKHLHQFVMCGWRYGGHRDGALQFFDGQDTLSPAASVSEVFLARHTHESAARGTPLSRSI